MLKGLFGSRPTNKFDVILAAGTAVMAVAGFFNVYHEYKNENEKENDE